METTTKKGLIEGIGFWDLDFEDENEFNKVIEYIDFHKILSIKWNGRKVFEKNLRTPFPTVTIYTDVCIPIYLINYIQKNNTPVYIPNID